MAIYNRSIACTDLLLTAPYVNPNIQVYREIFSSEDDDGNTPLHVISELKSSYMRDAILSRLLSFRNISHTIMNNEELVPLQLAIMKDQARIMRMTLQVAPYLLNFYSATFASCCCMW
ncbi:unnamed protein product [Dracunculus medinensis]|uniref:ANK_REP_REGION domain-containing protein n=1 Tax=Dracunculus medinensis TaxID=318479 RepID=A0A3P7PWP1_DRAME|nr:unnamed protein product [Dracunculus medinensis]